MNNLTESAGTGERVRAVCRQALGRDPRHRAYFQAFPDYGPERMGAPIRAYTSSPEPITIHSQIHNPNVVLVLIDPAGPH